MIAEFLDNPFLAYGTALLVGLLFVLLLMMGKWVKAILILAVCELFSFSMRYWLPLIST